MVRAAEASSVSPPCPNGPELNHLRPGAEFADRPYPGRAWATTRRRPIEEGQKEEKKPLSLPRFAIGVAQVACSLSGGLILNHARNAPSVSLLARLDLGSGRSIGGSLTFGCLGANALLLLDFCPFSLGSPCLPGRGYGQTLCLPCKPGRFLGFLCGTKGLKKSSFCVGSGAAAICEIIVSGVFQICVPFEVSQA
jgi:hypothetical protein